MRRDLSTTKHPEVEQSNAELEEIEGKKIVAQQHVLTIAEDKKRVEENRVASIKQLDTEIAEKNKVLKKLNEDHLAIVSIHETKRINAINASETVEENLRKEQERYENRKRIFRSDCEA